MLLLCRRNERVRYSEVCGSLKLDVVPKAPVRVDAVQFDLATLHDRFEQMFAY